MALVTSSLAPLLKLKIKPRVDDYGDQFNRILMVKLSLISCIILGLHWFKDTITCIVPGQGGIDGGFVKQACWIQGLYIYDDALSADEDNLRYFGIPKQLQYDGKRGNDLCVTANGDDCVPMKKIFYLQYQWFPFYMGAIALLYYLPYIFYRFVNGDLISLKAAVKASQPDVTAICHNYMNHQVNPPSRMTMRVIGNIIGKIFYVVVNIIALAGSDRLLNGSFVSHGSAMTQWGSLTNSDQLDYTSTRTKFRAGDRLLPAYGICEVLELAKDIKHTLYNSHKFVCEISQNVLYQYTLTFLWFAIIIALLVSIIGLVRALLDQFLPVRFSSQGSDTHALAKEVGLTMRECQYLEYVRKKKLAVYNEVVKTLREQGSRR